MGIWRCAVVAGDRYLIEMTDAIDRLAGNPNIVRERIEFSPPVRIYSFRSHIVVFRSEDDVLDVIRIRHGHEAWASDPVGDA